MFMEVYNFIIFLKVNKNLIDATIILEQSDKLRLKKFLTHDVDVAGTEPRRKSRTTCSSVVDALIAHCCLLVH